MNSENPIAKNGVVITPGCLRELLTYNPETGKLTWKPRPRSMFITMRDCKFWNTRFACREAFTATNARGYKHGRIWRVSLIAHRVIWAVHHGEWPQGMIDHINQTRDDNRIVNLRVVDPVDNCKNQKVRSDSLSGFTGVNWDKRKKMWRATLFTDGKRILLGNFSDKEDAIAARAKANEKYGFHKNHGGCAAYEAAKKEQTK